MEYTKNDIGYNLKLFDVEGVFFAHLFVRENDEEKFAGNQCVCLVSSSEINKVDMWKSISVSTIMFMRIIKNFNRKTKNKRIFRYNIFSICSSAYKNLNDLKKEFHEKIDSLINGSSDSNVSNESTTAKTTATNQQQTGSRRPVPDDPLIDPLAAGRRPHPYAGGW